MKISFPKMNTKKGFTLIETFIAISILMIAVVGPITIAQRSLSSAKFSRDRVIAYYLAQDAVEYIRSIRDDSYLQGKYWDDADGFFSRISQCRSNSTVATQWCYLDTQRTYDENKSLFPGASNPASFPNLNYNTVTGVYNYDNLSSDNQPTSFTRSISIRNASTQNGEDEIVIQVDVHWESGLFGSGGGSFTTSEHLLDWQI